MLRRGWFPLGIVGAMVLAVTLLGSLGLRSSNPRRALRIQLAEPAKDVDRLRHLGYELITVNREAGWADVITSGYELEETGLVTLREENLDEALGPDTNYHTPDEVAAELKSYADRFPRLATLKNVGKSTEGRDVWALKITTANYVDLVPKPVVLFNAMHHAREVMSTEIALDTIDYLLTRFETDDKVRHWLEATEIWVMPMLNVDGSNRVWTSDNMWRKNTKGGYGVDINRNYPWQWGSCNGSSGSRSDDTFRGPSAGSEVETQLMVKLVGELKPTIDISYHSYGEMVIYPYGCDGERTPQADIVATLGKEMATKLKSESGSGNYRAGTSWELLYAVDGGDVDWMYGAHHVLAYVIEVNADFGSNGFQPPFSRRQGTVERLRPAWGFLLDRLDGAGIHGRVKDRMGTPITDVTITLASQTDRTLAEQAYEVNAEGVFHILVKPGTYTLTFKALAGRTFTKTLTVEGRPRPLTVIM